MDAYALVMLNKAFECLSTIVGALQALYLGFGRVVSSNKVQKEGMNLDRMDRIRITFN